MLVLDATTLTALLDAHPQMYDLWAAADRGELDLLVPAGVVLDVAADRQVSAGAWAPLLWPTAVKVTALTETVAIEIGLWTGPLSVRHSLWESRTMDSPILTFDPRPYGPDANVIVV